MSRRSSHLSLTATTKSRHKTTPSVQGRIMIICSLSVFSSHLRTQLQEENKEEKYSPPSYIMFIFLGAFLLFCYSGCWIRSKNRTDKGSHTYRAVFLMRNGQWKFSNVFFYVFMPVPLFESAWAWCHKVQHFSWFRSHLLAWYSNFNWVPGHCEWHMAELWVLMYIWRVSTCLSVCFWQEVNLAGLELNLHSVLWGLSWAAWVCLGV